MDKKANNHTNSAQTRPHNSNKTSPSDDDILADIRDEYREAKEQLHSYNKFIDRHTQSISIIPILLSFVGIVVGAIILDSGNESIGIFTTCLSLVLFVASLVLITICSTRRSSVVKIENRMKDLRQEAVSYQHAIRLGIDKDGMSRGELGLFQESGPRPSYDQDDDTSKQSAGITVLGALAVVVWIISAIAVSSGGTVIVPAIAAIITLITSIILMTSSKRADKHNGRTLLILFLIIAGINFTVTLNNAQKAQQNQKDEACAAGWVTTYNEMEQSGNTNGHSLAWYTSAACNVPATPPAN